jgi:putative transposase
MPEYRRHRLPGATYVFALALANRRSDPVVHEIATLQAAITRPRQLYLFQIDAWVVLPEHMHAVWTLPNDDADDSLRQTLITRRFSATIPKLAPRRVGCPSAPHPTDATNIVTMHNTNT